MKITYVINDQMDVLIKFNSQGNRDSIYYFEEGKQLKEDEDKQKFYDKKLFINANKNKVYKNS